MRFLICERCNELDDRELGRHCLCRTPYDPVEVRARHDAAVEAARLSDRLRMLGDAPDEPVVAELPAA